MSSFWENLISQVRGRVYKTLPPPETDGTTDEEPSPPPTSPYWSDGSAWEYYAQRTTLLQSRKELYKDYDEMDEECSEYSSALDIYAYNATTGGDSEKEAYVEVGSDDTRVQKILDELLNRLDLQGTLWALARDIAKYGERAEEVVVNDKFNVIRLKPLPTLQILPNYNKYGVLDEPKAYSQLDAAGKTVADFESWQMMFAAHVKSRGHRFGTGFGFAARKAFKQLRLMEEAVVMARLTRATNRLVYKIDTTGLVGDESEQHMENMKARRKKRRVISSRTNRMDYDWNPLSVEEDIYIGVTKDSPADVKTLQGDLMVGNVDDLTMIQQKIFTAMKVPKSYLTQDTDNRTRAVMSPQDIQFARSVRRLQHIIIAEIRKICALELRLQGIDPSRVVFWVRLPEVPIVDELRDWQMRQLKMLFAQMFKQTFWADDAWIFQNVFGMDAEAVKVLVKGQKKPDKFNGLWQAPKIGTVKKNESLIREMLAKIPEEYRDEFTQLIDSLEMTLRWQSEEG